MIDQNIILREARKDLDVIEHPDCYTLIQYKRNKYTKEETKEVHIVNKEAVKVMAFIIKQVDVGYVVGYQWLVRKLMQHYDLEDMDINSWNGGKNRSKIYFPKHYYPLKVLEAWNQIAYFGNGSVMRLR